MSGKSRLLTFGEIELVRQAFPTGIRYDKVRLRDGHGGNPIARIAFSNGNWAITLGSTISYAPGHYRDDFSTGSVGEKGLLLHEMTHVWQYSRLSWPLFLARYGINLAASGFRPGRMYEYDDSTRFPKAKLEAQAQMVGHYCEALVSGNEDRKAKLARNLAGSGIYGFPKVAAR